MSIETEKIAKIFQALCDEKRVSIIKYLQTGEKCACNISDYLEFSQSKLSYHMKILCESGLVESCSVGKWTHYCISENGFKSAEAILKQLGTFVADTSDEACCNKQKAI